MSGLEIAGLVAGIIGLIGPIRHAYKEIKDLGGLPAAFHDVVGRLSVVEKTLQAVEGPAQEEEEVLVGDCDVSDAFVRVGKKGRVESLMSDILKDVTTLTGYRVFQTATQQQVEELKKAIEDMAQVEPSLSDSEFEEKTTSITHHGQGAINNATQKHHVEHQTDDDPYLGDLWLTDPRYDKKRIEELKGGLLRDSYRWILKNEAYKQWVFEDTPLLWIKGDPGKGKTMLVCGIIDTLHPFTKLANKDFDTFLSYFFIEASEERNNMAISVLRGLICLLADQDRSLASKLLRRHKECGKTLFEGANAWFALCEVLTDFMEDIQSPACLIIDALDECKTGLDDLLDFISSQPALPHVKWIVSSRNWPEIEEYLNLAPRNLRLSLELNGTAVSGAVNTYIQHRVEKLVTMKNHDDNMRQAVQKYLTENAHNTILWVSLACKMLKKTPKSVTLGRLKTLPPELIALYERMAEKVQDGEDGNENYSTLYRKIIATIMTVLRPISLDELRSLEEFPDGGSDDPSLIEIVGLCGSFLTLRARTIYFAHESAKEFLANSPAGLPYHKSKQHHRLFLNSLQAMSRHLRRDILRRESTQGLTSGEDPLAPLRYPCTFWAHHLSNSKSDSKSESDLANQELVDGSPLDTFLRQHFLHWLEALFSPDGSLVASLSSSRGVDLWDARTGNQRVSFKPSSWVSPVFSPDGSFVLLLVPSIIVAKDTITGATKWKIQTEFSVDSVTKPTISYDSRLLVLAVGSPVEVWDQETRECIRRLGCDDAGVLSLVFSHENRFLAAGTKDFIKVWDLTTWDSAIWDSTPSPIGNSDLAFGTHAMVFSPDGQFLTTSCFIGKTTYIDIYYVEEGVRKMMFSMEGCSFVRSVDPETSQLETTKGTFKLECDLESERLDLCRLGYGISEDLQWVIWGAEDGRIERR
ncbi:hypothetical protein CEP54_015353 [Fusarium duplospermum]|uniref:NACHT domain-containing protein n=1 Tax=Fusarium duplospermum TaxID=1325734 RepID=A0A428NPT5_9HYPO|nr:hypothetical protein CEP54_015353 [Fusarium duplospermum]